MTLARSSRRQAAARRWPMDQWMARAELPARPALLDELGLYTWHRRRGSPGAPLFEMAARRPLAAPQNRAEPAAAQLDAEV